MSFVGAGEKLQEEKGFCFLVPGCFLNRCSGLSQLLAPAVHSSQQHPEASNTQWPVAAPRNPLRSLQSKVPLMRHLPINSFPNKFQRVNFQQFQLGLFQCNAMVSSLPSVIHSHVLPNEIWISALGGHGSHLYALSQSWRG